MLDIRIVYGKEDAMTRDNGATDKPVAIAIVQARLGSQRFPRKMFADLNGKPVLWWVLDRLKKSKLLHQIVVATPDAEIAEYAYSQNCWGYLDTGDPNNVLGRYIKAANWSNAELVVRICGDCPLIDPVLVDNVVKAYVDNRVDISTNVLRRTYPKGMDVEVLHRNTLKRIYHLTEDPRYREHVTLYAYENPALFKFHGIFLNNDYSYLNVSIDTEKDLDKVRYLLSRINGEFGFLDIVRSYETVEMGSRN
jgi:spore coat polysaccharide biosynthesis protein SpsF